MVALNISSISVDSLLPPFHQTMYFRPVQFALPAVLPLTKAVLQCPVSGVIMSSQSFFKKDFGDDLLRYNISDIFPCWTKSTNVRKRIFFFFCIAVGYHCCSLGKNFKRPTVPRFVMKCISSYYSILNPFVPRRTVPTSTAVSL